jgi:uncharacterized protein (DUF1810 family)
MNAQQYDLQRFIDAQEPEYERVRAELRAGQKQGHWMWFVFPQLKGLGHSAMAEKFAISSLEEARTYLAHNVLGPRLTECTTLVVQVKNRTILEIFGYPDWLKFRSSMTLFANATQDNQIFELALAQYFSGERDQLTLSALAS